MGTGHTIHYFYYLLGKRYTCFMSINYSEHKLTVHTTKAGFRVINVQIDGYPIATSSVWLNVGSSQDPIKKLGLAHFFEHLFFTRTKTYPDRQKRLENIEKNGFLYDAFTSLEYQHYYYIHTPDSSQRAFDLLTDGLMNTIFDVDSIKQEKQVILSEEKQNHSDPSSYIWRLANRGLWGHDYLGKDFYGSKKTLKLINLDDLLDFYKKNFTSSNIRFVFINSSISNKLQNDLLDSITLNLNHPNATSSNLNTNASISEQIVFEKMPTDNCQISFSFLTKQVSTVKEKAVQDFIVDYLASGWTSRFIQRMRIEKDLVYWVYSDSSNLSNTGYIRFMLSTPAKNIEEIFLIFEDEIKKLLRSSIDQSILKMHKTKFIADVYRNSTDYNWLMQWYGFTSMLNGKPFTVQEFCNEISKLQPTDINEFARKYFSSDKLSIAYIFAKKLNFKVPTFQ